MIGKCIYNFKRQYTCSKIADQTVRSLVYTFAVRMQPWTSSFLTHIIGLNTLLNLISACGDLKAAKTEVIEGQTLQLEFSSSSHRFNTPDILLLRDKTDLTSQTEMFNRNLEDTEQRAKEFRDGSKFIYTITAVSKAQSGQYIVRCENGGYSNYATVTVISSAKKLNKGNNWASSWDVGTYRLHEQWMF